MDLEGIIVLILFCGAFLFLVIQLFAGSQKQKRLWKLKLKQEWGRFPGREYEYEELDKISRYFYYQLQKGKIEEPYIDNITWNDLDMEAIFMLLNQAKSSAGEEYLYRLLRTPETDEAVLLERERLIRFFSENEKAREEVQLAFLAVGKTRRFSISDYIDTLLVLESKSSVRHYIALLTIPAGLLLMALPVFPMTGVLSAMIAACVLNIISYYKRKGEIDPYITTFGYLLKILNAVEELEKIKVPQIEEYINTLSEAKRRFSRFRRGSQLLMSAKKATGSLSDVFLDYVRMLFHVDLIKFDTMLADVKKNVEAIDIFIEQIGILESAVSIASFRESLPYYTVPELEKTTDAYIELGDVYHPMIEEPVANSLKESRSILITGSNASGKSTFLKTAAINAILAQTIHTCTAARYRAPFYQVYSSMALKDSLKTKESYFIVEIKSLKRILNHAGDELPMLCFVDEVLRGTNTVERISASAQILRSLVRKNVLCFAATHDIELTHLLEKEYSNYHFQEEIQDNDVLFHYELKEGRAVSRNAIRLLGIIGYEEEIIKKAEETAANFLKTGEWTL